MADADTRTEKPATLPVGSQQAEQVAQQVAEAVGQSARQAAAEATRQVLDASRTAASQEVGAEREAETGSDEFHKSVSYAWSANLKRTHDEYQHESLESIRRNRTLVDRMAGLSVDHDQTMRNLGTQAMQNAIETANMLGKQAVAHRDIAIDRTWNVDEVATLVAKSGVFQDAIAAAVASGVAKVLNPPPAK